jgi:hypothetical protein
MSSRISLQVRLKCLLLRRLVRLLVLRCGILLRRLLQPVELLCEDA